MKKPKKIIDFLRGFLPVSRKTYMKDLQNTITVLDGLIQSEAQHSQLEMNLMANVEALKQNAQQKQTKNGKNTRDPAYN